MKTELIDQTNFVQGRGAATADCLYCVRRARLRVSGGLVILRFVDRFFEEKGQDLTCKLRRLTGIHGWASYSSLGPAHDLYSDPYACMC